MATTRRSFLLAAASGTVAVGCAGSAHAPAPPKSGGGDDEVTPVEDLAKLTA